MKIRTIIVDDEQKSIASLRLLLENHCPQVEIAGTAGTVQDAVAVINNRKPDLVFLDIAMPDGYGFHVLEQVDSPNFGVIFVTAYNQYALKAFDFSAIHYLLKPINPVELQKAVSRYEKMMSGGLFAEKIKVLQDSLNRKPDKIILPATDGLEVINISDIIRCEADSNYTLFFLISGKKIVVSKSLNNFEKILSDIHFCRVHNKHLINMSYVKHYSKGKGGQVVMQDGSTVDVSESRKKLFLNNLKNYARSIS